MDEKQIRRLSKQELLEVLLAQAKRIEELEKLLDKSEKQLNSKKILIDESGTLAEAALKLNDIFKLADESARQYLQNIKEKCKKIENEKLKACELEKTKILQETEALCQEKITTAENECKKKEAETAKKLKDVTSKIKELNKKLKQNSKNNDSSKNVNSRTKSKKIELTKEELANKRIDKVTHKEVEPIKKKNLQKGKITNDSKNNKQN